MPRPIVKTPAEVDALLEKAAEMVSEGSDRFKAMTYVEGIMAALVWLLYPDDEEEGEDPLE